MINLNSKIGWLAYHTRNELMDLLEKMTHEERLEFINGSWGGMRTLEDNKFINLNVVYKTSRGKDFVAEELKKFQKWAKTRAKAYDKAWEKYQKSQKKIKNRKPGELIDIQNDVAFSDGLKGLKKK